MRVVAIPATICNPQRRFRRCQPHRQPRCRVPHLVSAVVVALALALVVVAVVVVMVLM